MEIHDLEILKLQPLAPEHYWLELQNKFKAEFLPGQFIHLRISPCFFLRRPFSVARVTPKKLGILFRVVGQGTNFLSQKIPGEKVNALGPLGTPFPVRNDRDNVWLVAGGTGLACLLPLLRKFLYLHKKPILFYGARCRKLLFTRLLPQKYHCFHISTDDGSSGFCGPVTDLVARSLKTEKKPDVIFAAGPLSMLKEICCLGSKHQIPVYVSLERQMACGTGLCSGCVIPVKSDGKTIYQRVCCDGPVFSSQQIAWEIIEAEEESGRKPGCPED